jgi:membrane-associated PAP2 superfamily phosphatase
VARLLCPAKDPAENALRAIALSGIVVGLAFGLWPKLDLGVSALFYDAAGRTWPWAQEPTLQALRDFNAFVTRSLIAGALIALLFAAAGMRSFALMAPRTAVFLLAALIAGPGLIANLLLKTHWGRPRPSHVGEFGGALEFAPWWRPFGGCPTNCSFVSGEAAGAFALLAVAAVLPRRYRAAAFAAAIVYGLAVGLMRVAMGGHFLSDVLFAGIFTALAIWLLHGALFRWRETGRAAASRQPRQPHTR